MMRSNEIALADHFDENGRLATTTTATEWARPYRVEIVDYSDPLPFGRAPKVYEPTLKLFRYPEDKAPYVVRPRVDLLERFIDLGDATETQLRNFASRYGGLDVFGSQEYKLKGELQRTNASFESCNVWRYFARVMFASLRIASRKRQDGEDSRADWETIATVPSIVSQIADNRDKLLKLGYRDDPELHWAISTRFLQKEGFRHRFTLVDLFNQLLALGKVRPWLLWPEDGTRARVVYSSPRLLSYLSLQLCLRVGKVNAFVVCSHCGREYTPTQRAPKANQRNFCPECRKAGIPKKYALKDYREKQRSERHG
ncbi:MAG: hypothetical protein ABIR70_13510 [Bryobacteraceae bacterium]